MSLISLTRQNLLEDKLYDLFQPLPSIKSSNRYTYRPKIVFKLIKVHYILAYNLKKVKAMRQVSFQVNTYEFFLTLSTAA